MDDRGRVDMTQPRTRLPYAAQEALTFVGACSLIGGVFGAAIAWFRNGRA